MRRAFNAALKKIVRKRPRRKKAVWEFLLDVIVNPAHNPRLIEWKDKAIGEFRINRPGDLADLWTKYRGYKTKVKYESFARGLRYSCQAVCTAHC